MMIDDIFQQVLTTPDHIVVPHTWGQGQTTYGGLSAALLLLAMQQAVPTEQTLKSITTGFSSVLKVDEPFSIKINVLKQGRSVTQIQASIFQHNIICAQSQACFASPRNSRITVPPEDMTEVLKQIGSSQTPAGQKIGYIPNLTPICLQYFDLLLTLGDMPFSGSSKKALGGWMRFTTPPNLPALTFAHVLAQIDAWPPAMLPMLTKPAPASTLYWTVDFYQSSFPEPHQYLAYLATILSAGDGYGYTQSHITDQQGTLLAISRQTISIYDN